MYDERCNICGGEKVPLGRTTKCFDCGRVHGDGHTTKRALLNAVNRYGDRKNTIENIDGERGVVTVTDSSGWTRDVNVTTLIAGGGDLPEWSELWSGLYDGVGEVAVYYADRDVIQRYRTEPPLDVFVDSLDTGPDPELQAFLESLDTGPDPEIRAVISEVTADV